MRYHRTIGLIALTVLFHTFTPAQPVSDIVEGELWVIEDAPGGRQYAVRTAAYGTLELKLDASQGALPGYWTKMKTGMKVRVRGVRQGNTLLMASPYALDLRQGGQEYQEHLLPNTTGTQSVLLILADYSNTSPPYLQSFGHNRLSNEVTAAFEEFSFGQFSLTVTTTAWLPIALTNATCNFLQLADQADAAATAAGFALGDYQRLVYGFSFTGACNWSGLSTVGGAPSRAWLNGIFAVKVAIHELGHSLGLWHSHSLDCSPVIVTTGCIFDDYGDWLDTMGLGPVDPTTGSFAYPHFTAFQKEHLGWLGGLGPPLTQVTSSGVYRVGPYAVDDGAPKSLKLGYASPPDLWLYAETRQPFGTEAFLVDYPDITAGVLLHLGNPDDGTTSYLLDAHPETDTWHDAALRVGDVFAEDGAGFQLHVLEVNPDGATVAVDLDSDVIGLTLLSPWQSPVHHGDILRIQVLVSVGSQPAEGALWEWGFTVPGYPELFRQPDVTLGSDGIWTLEIGLAPDLPVGLYVIYARAGWFTKTTGIVSGQLTLQ